MSDPLVEYDRTAQRRSTFLVAAIGVIVMAVVVLVILRSQGPEDQPDVDRPVSPSARLSHSSTLVDTALQSFRTQHQAWPERVWTDGRDLLVTGPGARTRLSPGVDDGVSMGWYRSSGERFAYCLTRKLRALTVVTTASGTDKQETAGACPAASVTPKLTPGSSD